MYAIHLFVRLLVFLLIDPIAVDGHADERFPQEEELLSRPRVHDERRADEATHLSGAYE